VMTGTRWPSGTTILTVKRRPLGRGGRVFVRIRAYRKGNYQRHSPVLTLDCGPAGGVLLSP